MLWPKVFLGYLIIEFFFSVLALVRFSFTTSLGPIGFDGWRTCKKTSPQFTYLFYLLLLGHQFHVVHLVHRDLLVFGIVFSLYTASLVYITKLTSFLWFILVGLIHLLLIVHLACLVLIFALSHLVHLVFVQWIALFAFRKLSGPLFLWVTWFSYLTSLVQQVHFIP